MDRRDHGGCLSEDPSHPLQPGNHTLGKPRPPAAADRFDVIIIVLHWIVAILVLVQFFTGWASGGFNGPPDGRGALFGLHVFSGYAILILAIAWLAWRVSVPVPPLPSNLPRSLRVVAGTVHAFLYMGILAQPMLGVVAASAYGTSLGSWPGEIHVTLAFTLAGLAALHLLATVWHQWIRRDGLLFRMLPVHRRSDR